MTNPISGRTLQHSWTEGAFSGSTFRNTYHTDGHMTYRAVEGAYKGAQGDFGAYSASPVSDTVWLLSWLETAGYTVTIAFNFATMTVVGVVSNTTEWYPMTGTFVHAE